jgi:hypothetical protein
MINMVTIKTMLDDNMLGILLFDLYSYLAIIDGCLSPPRAYARWVSLSDAMVIVSGDGE